MPILPLCHNICYYAYSDTGKIRTFIAVTLHCPSETASYQLEYGAIYDWGEIRTLGAFQLIGIQSRRTRPTMRPSHTTQEGFEPSYRFRLPDFESGAINQLCHCAIAWTGFEPVISALRGQQLLQFVHHAILLYGGSGTRTHTYGNQNPGPYHLAIPHSRCRSRSCHLLLQRQALYRMS